MTIQAQLPDGRILEFPDGTDPSIIQATVKKQLGIAQAPIEQPQQAAQPERGIGEQILGGLSGAATVASDIAGTSVGGLTALVDVLNPFTDNDPEQLIESIKSKFRIEPSEGGEAGLNQLASAIEPAKPLIDFVSQFTKTAADQGLDLTGSPAFATFVNIIPDIIAEASGFGAGKRAATTALKAPVVSQAKRTAIASIDTAEGATGIRKLTSDVLPPETRVGKLLQTQGELVAGFQRKGQQGQRIKAVQDLVNKFDVESGSGFEAKIVKSLKDSISNKKVAIGKLYDDSTAKLDKLGNVPLTKTKEFANKVIAREVKKGTRADQTVITDMQSLVDAPDDLSFELIKEIRSGVGANLEKVKRGAPVQGNSDTALLKRTYGQLSNDMEAFAKAADPSLAKKWKKANDVVSEFALGTSKKGAKSVIKNGDATPEIVDTLLFSKNKSDLQFLNENLNKQGKQAAKQRVLQRMLDKSSIDGDDINPNKFLSQMNRHTDQIKAFFSKEERAAILALKDDLSQTRRAQDASVVTPTGQQLTLAAAVALPLALVPGVLQGVIESKVIRNLLIKRKASKSAKARVSIDDQIRAEINRSGLTGASVVSAGISTNQSGQEN